MAAPGSLRTGMGTLLPKSHRNGPAALPCLCLGSGRVRHMFPLGMYSFSCLLLASTNTMNAPLFSTARSDFTAWFLSEDYGPTLTAYMP